MKAQATIEYLILAAVLLILAIIAIALFAPFPDFANSIQEKQSQDFWKNQARPFTVEDAFYDRSNGRLYLAVKSHSETPLKITELFINDTSLSLFKFSPSAFEGAGNPYCDAFNCESGCSCQLNMSPFADSALATEYLVSSAEICGQKVQSLHATLQITYTGMALGSPTFSQTGAFPLILECKDSFNN
ncbi:MAG: hypothetical protein V1822_04030 [Candidatus Micrarchaeota archaeon]